MRFCPFCGAEIIVPDQDGIPVDSQPAASEERFDFDRAAEDAKGSERPRVNLLKPIEETPEWTGGDLSEEDNTEPEPEAPAEKEPEPVPPRTIGTMDDETPISRRTSKRASEPVRRRVPTRPSEQSSVSLDNMFMEDDEDDEDDFDAFERAGRRIERRQRRYESRYEDDDDDDDEEEGFFFRHLRAFVGIILLLALLGGMAFYAMTDDGQTRLAQVNVTLPFIRAEIYSRLGYEAYQEERYSEAGAYYERALAREPENYDYASSAAMAYVNEKNADKAAELLKRCVELRPDAAEPYIYLLNLYPNPDTRPWEITRLVDQGYQQTGDQRLKQS